MFSTLRWVFKYCYCDRPQWGITYSGVFLRSFLVFSSTIPHCFINSRLSTGFPHVYGFQFPSGSFSLASPCVPMGDFVTFVSFFPFCIILILMFSSLVFVQDCCCLAVTYESFCRMRTDGTRCMIFSSFKKTVHMRLSDTGSRR